VTDDELTDQAAADLIRCYVKQNTMALLIRTRGTAVSIICPDGDRVFMAALLRAAANGLDEPASKRLN
jgi:hypothetical protein